jgi:hypothetical protein
LITLTVTITITLTLVLIRLELHHQQKATYLHHKLELLCIFCSTTNPKLTITTKLIINKSYSKPNSNSNLNYNPIILTRTCIIDSNSPPPSGVSEARNVFMAFSLRSDNCLRYTTWRGASMYRSRSSTY